MIMSQAESLALHPLAEVAVSEDVMAHQDNSKELLTNSVANVVRRSLRSHGYASEFEV